MNEGYSAPRRIHILGIGNLGRLFAHALANSTEPPPITLLLHRQSLMTEWEAAGRKISITTNGVIANNGRFDVEDISSASAPDTPISNLIITTKTISTITALRTISHRLNAESTILFTQNGMGTLDEASSKVFDDPSTRPNYLTAIISHGVYSLGPFSSVHAGQAFMSIGRSLQSPAPAEPSKAQYLLNTILLAPILAAKEYPSQELFYLQLEKLIINAIINPLTAMFDCKNGELFDKAPVMKLMRLLLQEASHVIQRLPEIQRAEDAGVGTRFAMNPLETKVLDVAEKTAANTSSMLQDVRAGRTTEIDYINGWIVRKGRDLGVDCKLNAKLVEMVKGGKKIGVEEIGDYFETSGIRCE